MEKTSPQDELRECRHDLRRTREALKRTQTDYERVYDRSVYWKRCARRAQLDAAKWQTKAWTTVAVLGGICIILLRLLYDLTK